MKKVIIAIMVVTAIALGAIAVRISARSATFGGRLGFYNPSLTYEFLYMKSSTEQQRELDYLLVTAIKDTDGFNTLAIDDAIALINDLKQDIADNYPLNIGNYGPMMGNNSNSNCHNVSYRSVTFEWVYVHSSKTTQEEMMTLLVTEMQLLDFNTMSVDDSVTQFRQIKTQIIDRLGNA